MTHHDRSLPARSGVTRPRLGFLGTGWIGRNRMEAVVASGLAEVVAVADPSPECRDAAAGLVAGARACGSLDELLACAPDGVVIATPSALHTQQTVAALERGAAVFCQKPLGRDAAETRACVDAARAADRLLGVDLSYRRTAGMAAIREAVAGGEIGTVHMVDLVFHNAYGPDKDWFYDPRLSGGGCVVDLGIHLVDLALWVLGFPDVVDVSADLYAAGQRLPPAPAVTEDAALATLRLATGTTVRLACSWRLHAGRDAVISAAFHGTAGGLSFANVGGSFYDFAAERFTGTSRAAIAAPPDDWGGRAILDWTARLAAGSGFDPEIAGIVDVAAALDRIYGR